MCSPDGKINFLLIQRTEKLTIQAKKNQQQQQTYELFFLIEIIEKCSSPLNGNIS